MKKICPTHHFRYEGFECPICRSERVSRMVERHEHRIKKDEEKVVECKPEPTWEDLASKYNVTFGK